MSKKFDISKLTADTPKKMVLKSVTSNENEAVTAIHRSDKAVRTSLDIPEDIHRQIKLLSVHRGISMKDLMLQFFVEGLAASKM
ncbi:MAG: hypothetical protein AAB316_25465 [Bacteroidota bacterium]